MYKVVAPFLLYSINTLTQSLNHLTHNFKHALNNSMAVLRPRRVFYTFFIVLLVAFDAIAAEEDLVAFCDKNPSVNLVPNSFNLASVDSEMTPSERMVSKRDRSTCFIKPASKAPMSLTGTLSKKPLNGPA